MSWARRTSIVLAGTLVLAFAGGPSSLIATGSPPGPRDDGERVISGDAWMRAREAALAAIPGCGHVTDSEVGDEDSFYEIEVTLHDGRTVDVQLDSTFGV
jgi:hypothetical protein